MVAQPAAKGLDAMLHWCLAFQYAADQHISTLEHA